MDLSLPPMIERWDELEDWVQAEAEFAVHGGMLPPTLAVSFVGDRPDLFVKAPTFLLEDADVITDTLVDLFALARPERLAITWPNRFEHPDTGEVQYAVRINSAIRTGGAWTWRTRVHAYTFLDGCVEWGASVDLPRPPDPWSRRLRRTFTARRSRTIQRRGWIDLPGEPGWIVAAHPESTTLDDLVHRPDLIPRNGRLVPKSSTN